MGKYDKLVIRGEQRSEADIEAVARVIILLARQWVQEQQAAPEKLTQSGKREETESPESEASL